MKSTVSFWIRQCETQEEWRTAIQSAGPDLVDDLARLTWLMWKRTADDDECRRRARDERRAHLAKLVNKSRAQVVARALEDMELPDGRKFINVPWFELEELKITYRAWAGLIEWCQKHIRINDDTVTVGSVIKPRLLRHQAEIRGLIAMQADAA